jgi:hypothetical protein
MAHVPLLQQPPLHGLPRPHDVEHLRALQAMCIGHPVLEKHPQVCEVALKHVSPWFDLLQSPSVMHPQFPAKHAVPCAALLQSVQDGPHVAPWVSSAHIPPPQQKPEPHVPSCAPPHWAVHCPPAHVGFCGSVHPTHAVPTLPHAPLSVPG